MLGNLIEKLQRRVDLTEAEAATAMSEIMGGQVASAQIAGMLVALSIKGERVGEIVGFAGTMREKAVQLSRSFTDVFDTCGTGGDGLNTFNVSSVSAVVLAACGVRVAKHGNRSVSSKCGSADLFEGLGVNVSADPQVVERCLADAGIAFFFAPTFHPAMRHVSQTRRELGVRTVFNLLGPLTNPAGAKRQVIGVPASEYTDLIAQALMRLGSEHAWVVHGAGGIDEVSTSGYTKVSECRAGSVRTFFLHPDDFGVEAGKLESTRVSGLDESIKMTRDVLGGATGVARNLVLVNVAAGLLVTGSVGSLVEGATRAALALDDGSAAEKLADLVRCSQGKVD